MTPKDVHRTRQVASADPAARRPAAGGDADGPSFEAFFRDHWIRVVLVLVKLVGSREDAEEITLDVFMKLDRIPLPPGSAARGWLYRAATRAGLNERPIPRRTPRRSSSGRRRGRACAPSSPA